MGMNGYLMAISPADAAHLRAHPEAVSEVVMGQTLGELGALTSGDPAALLDGVIAGAAPGCLWGWWPRFMRRWLLRRFLPASPVASNTEANTTSPPAPEAAPEGETPRIRGELLALHKDWHVVHFLVAGTAGDPTTVAGRAVLGGEEIGEDLGYGPARLLSGAEVITIAAALQARGVEGWMKSFRQAPMVAAEVYSADGVEEEEAEEQLERLLAFYQRAATANHEVLGWIS